jgi:tripartite-type tricarboxylate transporter receptor subunit TctC
MASWPVLRARKNREATLRKLVLVAAALMLGLGAAAAQVYPSRPVTLVVPYPAGGPTDTLARIMAEPLRAALGQPVIIENVSGAGGAVGSGRVARAAPDGHTLIVGHLATHVFLPATQTVSYDVVADFEPIALLADTPQGIAGRRDLPAKDMKELIAWMKANPGKGTMGSVGVGGPSDVSAILFQQQTGTSFRLIPYRGGAPLLQDLVGGQIDLGLFQASAFLEQVRSGQIKAYAIMSRQRMAMAPDIPTMEEAGVPQFVASIWHGLWAPKGTPKDITSRLNAAVSQALADATLQKRFADIAQDIWPREQQSPEALAAHQKAEIEKWWPIIKAANITVR